MKRLTDILSKNNGFVFGDYNPKLELFCESIQEWIVNEFAQEVQNWVVEEFSTQIEAWVKDYMNDKRTQLHIEDFCADDSNDAEETHIELNEKGKMTKEEKKTVRKALELAYQVIKKEEKYSKNFEYFKETLVDDYIEWDNGYSDHLLRELEKRWDNEKE